MIDRCLLAWIWVLPEVLKCGKDDDICTLKIADEADLLDLIYEAKSECVIFFMLKFFYIDSDRIAEYDTKFMCIDPDTLGLPETEYEPHVTMPSSEFTHIIRDLSQLDENVCIKVSKERVWFVSEGEAANGRMLFWQGGGAAISGSKTMAVKEEAADGEAVEGSMSEKKGKKKVKKEKSDNVEMVARIGWRRRWGREKWWGRKR